MKIFSNEKARKNSNIDLKKQKIVLYYCNKGCASGEIGRRAGFRFRSSGVGVQVPSCVPINPKRTSFRGSIAQSVRAGDS